MKTTRRLSAFVGVAVILAALFVMSAPGVKADNAQTMAGTWVVWFSVGPGMQVPALHTYQPDGSVVATDTFSQGGLPGVPIRTTPLHGTWVRTGVNSFASNLMFLVYDAPSSVLIGFGRGRATVTIAAPGANEASGTVILEFLGCSSPVACPDPQAPDAAWVPFPDFPSSAQVTAKRLRVVE